MTRIFDPRNNGRMHRKAKPVDTPIRAIVGGQPTCHYCGQPATEISLPSGTPVCARDGDSRGLPL